MAEKDGTMEGVFPLETRKILGLGAKDLAYAKLRLFTSRTLKIIGPSLILH